MYKRIFVCICSAFMAAASTAQVTLSLQVPPVGVMQKNQLWNMIVVYTGDNSINVYVGLSLLSTRDNRPMMTATTRPFVLSKGARQLSAVDITPVQYSYLSPVFDVDRSPDGFLPIGNYKACYTIYKTEKDILTPMAEDCIPVEVQPLSPPLLNTPADAAVIETPYPQFTWLPAVPLNLFSNLNYDLLMVELLPGQTKGDAIQKNLPLYNIGSSKTPFNNYPASSKSLDTGRVYAWRVVAKNNDEFVAQTEIWTFKVAGKTKPEKTPGDGYAVLQNDLEGLYTVKEGILHIKYFSYDRQQLAALVFTDDKNQLVYQQRRQLVQGDNYLDFELGRRFHEGKIYQVTLTDADNKKHVLRFSISKNN